MRDIRCRGCFYKHYHICLLRFKVSLTQRCPCVKCLVKVMCENMCRDRKDLYLNISKNEKGRLLKMNNSNLKKGYIRIN